MNESLRLHVQRITKLPTIPAVAQEILKLADDDLASTAELVSVVENDPTISAKILSVANSAFFGYKIQSNTIDTAILRIGFNNVRSIALGVSLMTVLDGEKHFSAFDYQRIFKHSTAVGIISKYLAKELKTNIQDEIFVDGMLHDIGFLVLNRYFPDLYLKVLSEFKEGVSLLEAEKTVMGFTHADIGTWLADKWNLPNTVLDATLHHHYPSRAEKNQKHVAVTHMADYITSKNIFSMTGADPGYNLDPSVFDILKISKGRFTELGKTINTKNILEEIFNYG